jgi:hypothetical protein
LYQLRAPDPVLAIQVTPESDEVWIYPPYAPATTLVAVLSDVNEFHTCHPAPVLSIQVTPESDDV